MVGHDEMRRTFSAHFDQCEDVQTPKSALFPKNKAAIIAASESKTRKIRYLNWGFFLPQVSKRTGRPIKPKSVTNARCETIQTSRFWSSSFKFRRCLVPATGYCEPKGSSPAIYNWFGVVNETDKFVPFAFAGLWQNFSGEKYGGGFHSTFTIVTTPPNDLVKEYHNRMPLILKEESYDQWLFGSDLDSVKFLVPFESKRMRLIASGEGLKVCPTNNILP